MASDSWRPVPGFEGYYEVSDLGVVRGLRCATGVRQTPRPLAAHPNHKGYPQVILHREGIKRSQSVHRLVLGAFVGPCPEGHEADHINNVRHDNRLENLRWVTRGENNARRRWTRFTADDFAKVRGLRTAGESQRAIARQTGISQSQVCRMLAA